MKTNVSILIILLLALYLKPIYAQHNLAQVEILQAIPKNYSAKYITTKIEIDGKMDNAWCSAPWSTEFKDIEGAHKAPPTYKTKFKMLWDDNYLYIYAKLEETHVWGTLKEHDAIIYHDNDFEIFLKPKMNSSVYYEIEVNALNTIMDLMMAKPYRFGGQAIMHWDTKNLKSAVHIEGTLNNPENKDSFWAVEMAIPFKSMHKFGTAPTPKENSYWRINFSRVQWEHEVNEAKYSRKKVNGKHIPEENWVWSPIGLVNMHYPERWGFLHFTKDEISNQLPSIYEIEKTAWNMHYLQQIHKNKLQEYTADFTQLEGFSNILNNDLEKYDLQFTLSANKKFYHLRLQEKNSTFYFTIDSQGNYTTNYE